ncbi:low-density lipoprotein receptor-related protein 5-like protein [Argopecten irradians]|uniref:low-density lipoprotein receptor-related protein 5-like protein n=1 Tax=Argopecten irradians TaxID=31199 RepID=UPI00371E9FCF
MEWTIVLCGILTLTGAEYYVFMDGERPHEGNIQIYNGSIWFNLCTDGWDNNDATVICRMAGYTGNGAVARESNNGFTFSSLVNHKFDCTGTEQTLADCPTSSNNATACANSTLSHLTCSVDPAPNDFFLISFGNNIARMDRQTASVSLVQSGTVDRVIAITYDSVKDNIIWTDILRYQIAMCGLQGGNITVLYQAGNASIMDGMAIDEGSRLLFYTDTGYDEIGTVNIDTLVRTVIITTDLDEPRAIALDTVTREIFWTDWGASPTIKRANYDGSSITTLVNTGLGWPNALFLNGDVLTWCDAQVDVYERINRNGTGRTQLASFSSHCFDFTIFEDYIYANDWVYTQIQRIKTDGSYRDSFGPPLVKGFGIFHYIKENLF